MSNNIRVNIDNLASAIVQGLEDYTDEVIEDVNKVSVKSAKNTVDDLKETSPKRTGRYAKSWTRRISRTPGKPDSHRIYNKDHYRLTHLLEHGHAKVGGGRTKAIPHIKPAEEKMEEEFIKGVEEAIKNG